ncbi:hypothetical protein UA70_30490, partial [Raoultella planticola]
MKPYFALSLLAVMCCNVGAAEPQQTVVPHSADPILVTDGPQQDAALTIQQTDPRKSPSALRSG